MPQRDTSGIGERVPRALIEADLAVAFSLIDIAEGGVAEPLLRKAEGMLADIRARLFRMTPAQRQEFEPGCEKLAEALARAKAK